MIEHLDDLPAGTLGFRVSGHVDREDYTERVVPALREALAAGTPLSIYVEIQSLSGMSSGAIGEDLKTTAQVGWPNRHLLARTAVVTDLGWVRHVTELFGWLYPGDMRVFGLGQAEDARRWLAAPTA